jgi:hypothetical protein
VSLGRRLGRLARGFVSNNVGDERFKETVRPLRQRGETLRSAVGAAWRGAAAEWRAAEERAAEERAAAEEENGGERASAGRSSGAAWGAAAPPFVPRRYPPQVLYAYHRLGLNPGDPLESVNKRRRDLVKRHHPDRFVEPGQRARAERITAEINASHDLIERHLLR